MAVSYPGQGASKNAYAQWMASQVPAWLPREIPVMAGLTESGLTNINGGDRDSTGFFQMRQGIWNKGAYQGYQQNPQLQMKWFIDQATAVRNKWNEQGKQLTPETYGEFIADIERPAEQYRGRYQTRLGEARQLLGSTSQGSPTTGTVPTGPQLARVQAQGPKGLMAGGLQAARGNLLSTLASNSNPYATFTDTVGVMRGMFEARDPAVNQATGEVATSPNPALNVSADPATILAGGNSSGSKAVQLASKFIGTPYVWGGSSPKGFDCSGLIQYVYGKLGIQVPRVAADQFKSSTPVEAPQPGDLVFFKGYTKSATNPGHVGMYIGNGQYLQAPKTGDVVKISKLSDRTKDFLGFRRPGGNS